MKNLLNFENVVKLIGGVAAILGLYYALDKRLALIEQKMDYMVETYHEKEVEAKLQLAELKETNKEFNRDLQDLKERILKIQAILPKQTRLENEKD